MNPFAVLGLAPGCTVSEAKARYRELVKRHHPDVGGDEDTFKRIQAAWEILMGKRRVAAPRPPPRPQSRLVIQIVFNSSQMRQGGPVSNTSTSTSWTVR